VVSIIKDFLMKTIFKKLRILRRDENEKRIENEKKDFHGNYIITHYKYIAKRMRRSKVQKTNLEDSGTGRELKKFKVGYLASPGHVLYFVAKEKGFFEEEGLDVELFCLQTPGKA